MVGLVDGPQILDSDFAPILRRDHGIANFVDALVLAQRSHHVVGSAIFDGAACDVDVFLRKAFGDAIEGEAGTGQGPGIELDVNLLFEATANAGGGDALDGLKRPFDLQFGDASHAAQLGVLLVGGNFPGRGHAQFHDRIECWIKSQN